MADRSNKGRATVARRGRRGFPGPWPGATEALAALARAWTVTTIATALLVGALAVAPFWDTAIYLQALQDTLSSEPTLMPQTDEDPGALVRPIQDRHDRLQE
ncbi:MAG: hypothetical protein ACREET_01430 [Stellaceae bacterium]